MKTTFMNYLDSLGNWHCTKNTNSTTNQEELAIEKLYAYMDKSTENVQNDIDHDFLTNHNVNGIDYIWYLDGKYDVAINVETLEIVSSNLIEQTED